MKVLTYFIYFTLLYCQLVNSKEWNGRTLKRFYQTNTGKINTQTNIEYQNGYRLPLRPAPVGPAPVGPPISTYQPTIRPVTGPYQGTNAKNVQINNGYINNQANTEYKKRFYPIGPYQGIHAKNVQVNGNVGYQRNKFNKKRFEQRNPGKINTQTNIEYQNGYRLPLRPAPVGPAPVVPAPVVPAPVGPAPVGPVISTYQPTIRPVTGPYQGIHAKNVQVNGNVGYQRNKFIKKRFTQLNAGHINTQINATEYSNDTNSTEKKSKRATKICDTKTQVFEDGNGGRVTLLGDRYKGLAEKWGLTKRGCETISNGKGIDITVAGDPYKQLIDKWINQAS